MVKDGVKKKKKTSDFGYGLMVANALSSDLHDCDINSSISMRGERTLSSRAFYPTAECSDGIFAEGIPAATMLQQIVHPPTHFKRFLWTGLFAEQ
ncbi:hypothetical protein CDAR_72581 [Caerostris darwini]|uniref:Uncharacterized protein n=1 Tax=Caerostris darwini TaxID=1538125 RepID=A0AAV4MPZ0_9ARAC|nr:hypothetical protein CDAR_72581 [Caerostris darwini]